MVAEGAPKEIVTAELVEEVFGLRCQVIDDPETGTPLVVPAARGTRARLAAERTEHVDGDRAAGTAEVAESSATGAS